MNYLLPLIILIILACVYAGSLKNPKSRLTVVVVVLAFILVLCWLQMRGDGRRREGFMGFTGYAPVSGYNMRIAGDDGSSVGCGGYNYADVNSQVGPMGSYDGIRLTSKLTTMPLEQVQVFTPTGDGITLTEPLGNKDYISVDGNPNSPKFLFSYARNVSSPNCFGSSNLMSDSGAICYSPEQLKMFGHRGGNADPRNKEYPGI
jgi:hypothetical protein